jgi:hypothetical protein
MVSIKDLGGSGHGIFKGTVSAFTGDIEENHEHSQSG